LTFTVATSDKYRYSQGLYRSTPYSLTVKYLTQSIVYPVTLLGYGSSDLNADILKPMDYSKSLMSSTQIKLTAGKTASFNLECRTSANTRKSDASPSFSFKFSQKDNLSDGNY